MVATESTTNKEPAHVILVEPGTGKGALFDSLSERLDAQVLPAHSALDAVEMAGTCTGLRVAVICWNAINPECRELVASLRQRHPELAVILISDEASPDAVREAVAAEVDEFVVNPTSPDYIEEIVAEMISAQDLCWSTIP
jgi:DNA-binding NarL/FixJ family response regulator